jgi:hypothetical protein
LLDGRFRFSPRGCSTTSFLFLPSLLNISEHASHHSVSSTQLTRPLPLEPATPARSESAKQPPPRPHSFLSLSLPSNALASNILACHVRSCTSNNFPLELKDIEIEVREAEYNEDFLKGFWPKVEWKALVDTAKAVRALSFPWPFLSQMIWGQCERANA